MLRILVFVTLLLAAFCTSAAPPAQPQRPEFSVIRDYTHPIIVSQKASFLSLFQKNQPIGSGSAIVIAPGYAVSAYHVFGEVPKNITVIHEILIGDDKKEMVVKLVAKDEEHDIAIIQGDFKCPCAPITTRRPYQDQEAYAVGFPAYLNFGVQFVTFGHVQNKPTDTVIVATTITGPGGSGGGLFVKEDGVYKLAGVIDAIGTQPIAPQVMQQSNWMMFSSPASNIRELAKTVPDLKLN